MPATATVPTATPPAPLVSVVVPTYGRGAAILGTLESVFAQSFSDYELIVVDDGSPDDTVEWMRPLAAAGRIRLVVQANAGTAAARNRGLAEARGELIAFLDHDDLWPEDKLAWQAAFLRDHPEVDLVGGLLETMDENERPGEMQYSFEPGPFDFERLFRGNPLCSPGQWVARTATVRRLNGFNTQFWVTDDYEFLLRATRLARVVGVHRLALRYREHAASVSRNGPRMLRNSLAVARTQLGYVPAERRRGVERLFYRYLYRAIGRPMLVRAWGDLRARHFVRGLTAAWAGVRFFVSPALRDLPWFFGIVFEGVWSRLSGSCDGKAVARA